MMNSNILFWLLICGHFFGDFYLQSQKLVDMKKKKKRYLFLHSIIYIGSIIIFLLPVINLKLIWPIVIIYSSHLLVDFAKIKICNLKRRCKFIRRNAFCIDQLVHIAVILIIACFYANNNLIAINFLGNGLIYLYSLLQVHIKAGMLIKYICILFIIGKPSNILIKEINRKEYIKKICNEEGVIFFDDYSPEYQNAGKRIGTLERIIIVIMLVLKQYAAIGLIFTAKSITRYDKITKEPAFAEYYLVGTLMSLLISIASVLLIQVT